MKLVLFSLLFYTSIAFAQTREVTETVNNGSSDTLDNSFIGRLFDNDLSIKHHHIVDISLIDFWFSTAGYNYLYSINPNLRVGARLGLYVRHLDKDKYPTSILGLRFGCLGSYKIWRSLYAETSVSFIQAYGISVILGNDDPTKGKPGDFKKKSSSIFPMYEVGVNTTFYDHVFLRTGLNVIQDVEANNRFYIGNYLSIGYKF